MSKKFEEFLGHRQPVEWARDTHNRFAALRIFEFRNYLTVNPYNHHDNPGQRYIKNERLWRRFKHEAECCATISIIYASPTSSYHMTSAKYTRQDMVTIISGNIEAWLGLSAVHAYLSFEQFYDALLEAQLISGPSASSSSFGLAGPRLVGARLRRSRAGRLIAGLAGILISILTKVKFKLFRLFTYLFHRLAPWP